MEKKKSYPKIRFSAKVIRNAIGRMEEIIGAGEQPRTFYSVAKDGERWKYDNFDEFLASYQAPDTRSAGVDYAWGHDREFSFSLFTEESQIAVRLPDRSSIEAVFSTFDEADPADKSDISYGTEPIRIFIGHGRNQQWEKLKTHLQDQHSLTVIAYETGARAGHTIRDIIDDMAKNASFALLVLTGEDKTEHGLRARQNVIHECGLFQGRLGFHRALLLVEQGVELASNFDGIQQLRFKRGRISEVFGDVIATLKREFGPI